MIEYENLNRNPILKV